MITKNKRKRRQNKRTKGRGRKCVDKEIGSKKNYKEHYDKVKRNEEERNVLMKRLETKKTIRSIMIK
jgi:hypothetical protein